jgi:hypothetical protein
MTTPTSEDDHSIVAPAEPTSDMESETPAQTPENQEPTRASLELLDQAVSKDDEAQSLQLEELADQANRDVDEVQSLQLEELEELTKLAMESAKMRNERDTMALALKKVHETLALERLKTQRDETAREYETTVRMLQEERNKSSPAPDYREPTNTARTLNYDDRTEPADDTTFLKGRVKAGKEKVDPGVMGQTLSFSDQNCVGYGCKPNATWTGPSVSLPFQHPMQHRPVDRKGMSSGHKVRTTWDKKLFENKTSA